MASFSKWLDVLVEEKGIDPEQVLEVPGPSGPNMIPVACLMDAMKGAAPNEQAGIKQMLVKLDFLNQPIVPYFAHLAKAIAL
jgi:hypothetical protein